VSNISTFTDEVYTMILISFCQPLLTQNFHSTSGGGGGGSGGSVKLSACTLTAGSGASVESRGGNGGQARSDGENKMWCLDIFLNMYHVLIHFLFSFYTIRLWWRWGWRRDGCFCL